MSQALAWALLATILACSATVFFLLLLREFRIARRKRFVVEAAAAIRQGIGRAQGVALLTKLIWLAHDFRVDSDVFEALKFELYGNE